MKTLKKNLDKILYVCAAVLALVALFLMFAPASVVEILGSKTTYTGAQMAFGYENHGLTVFSASANILTYILFAIGMVSAILGIFAKSCKYPCYIAIACLLLAGIFSFCVVPFSVTDVDKELLNLGAGAICSGVFGILAAIVCAANLVIKPKKK